MLFWGPSLSKIRIQGSFKAVCEFHFILTSGTGYARQLTVFMIWGWHLTLVAPQHPHLNVNEVGQVPLSLTTWVLWRPYAIKTASSWVKLLCFDSWFHHFPAVISVIHSLFFPQVWPHVPHTLLRCMCSKSFPKWSFSPCHQILSEHFTTLPLHIAQHPKTAGHMTWQGGPEMLKHCLSNCLHRVGQYLFINSGYYHLPISQWSVQVGNH